MSLCGGRLSFARLVFQLSHPPTRSSQGLANSNWPSHSWSSASFLHCHCHQHFLRSSNILIINNDHDQADRRVWPLWSAQQPSRGRNLPRMRSALPSAQGSIQPGDEDHNDADDGDEDCVKFKGTKRWRKCKKRDKYHVSWELMAGSFLVECDLFAWLEMMMMHLAHLAIFCLSHSCHK